MIDRCLKTLQQKQLIKKVQSVQVGYCILQYQYTMLTFISLKHPTRKIFMLAHLEASVALTGGPWYTDNELDLEFIKALTQSCLSFIRGRVSAILLIKFHDAHKGWM